MSDETYELVGGNRQRVCAMAGIGEKGTEDWIRVPQWVAAWTGHHLYKDPRRDPCLGELLDEVAHELRKMNADPEYRAERMTEMWLAR